MTYVCSSWHIKCDVFVGKNDLSRVFFPNCLLNEKDQGFSFETTHYLQTYSVYESFQYMDPRRYN